MQQFGYNNDYVGYVEWSRAAGLLCVNHEYTNEEVMFPGLGRQDKKDFADMTAELVASRDGRPWRQIVEIQKGADGTWSVNKDSPFNRRVTAKTEMTIDGPAAGNARMKTNTMRPARSATAPTTTALAGSRPGALT